MKELRTEIEIQAFAEKVWQIHIDFASFPKWNPFGLLVPLFARGLHTKTLRGFEEMNHAA